MSSPPVVKLLVRETLQFIPGKFLQLVIGLNGINALWILGRRGVNFLLVSGDR